MDDLAKLSLKVDSTEAGDASKVLDGLTKSAEGTATSAELLSTSFKRLAIVLGPAVVAGALVEAALGAYHLQEQYARLSEVAGTLPSQMAALDLPSRLAGTSLDAVAQAVARLSKNIGEAQAGGTSQRNLLKALGIDPSDGTDPVDRFVQISRAIMGMKDANVQAYASQSILNRSFAEMRPVMKEIIEAGGLHKRQTDEEIVAAKRFTDQMTSIRFEMEQSKIAMANDYLPWLTDIVKSFAEGYKQGGLFQAAIEGIATAITGTDLYKANKEMTDLFVQMQNIEKKMEEMRENQKNGVPEMAVPGRGPQSIADWQKQLDQMKARYDEAKRYRDQLEELSKAKTGGGKAGAEGDSANEDAVKKLMEDNRLYEERIAAIKGFTERYAAAIDTNNTLIRERRKQGEISEEAAVLAISHNEDAKLQVYAQSYLKLEKLAKDHGDLGKTKEQQEAAAKANAARVANEAITGAQITSIRTVQDLEFQRGVAQRSAEQTMFFKDDLTRLEGWLAEQNNLNEEARNLGLRDEEEYQSRLAEIYAYYEEHKTNIIDEQVKKRYQINAVYRKMDLDSAGAFFGYMKLLMQVKSKEMFEIGKLGAIGETVVNTYRAAQGAYAALSGIPIVGPALGVAAAAAAVAAGLAQVQAIRSTQYGGGGAAVPTFSANPTTGAPTAPAGAQAGASGSSKGTVTVNLNVAGNIIGTQEFVDKVLIPSLRDSIDNRDFVIIGDNSRQAANLVG